ncbi:MAG: TyeA family type III secretion system gatekeeper subunit [Betaproteobacteria bacterium]
MSSIQSFVPSTQTGAAGFAPAASSGQVGQTTLLPDVSSTLSDAAEELTQSLAGKAQEKSIKERKGDNGRDLASLTRAQRVAMIMAMAGVEQQPEQPQELARGALKQPGQVKRQAREGGGTACEQYLALLEAADLIDEGRVGVDPGGRGAEALREAAAEVLAEHGGDIRADVNTFEATRILTPEQAAQFRSTYRDVVLGQGAVNDTLRRLLDMQPKGQGGDFSALLETTRQSLGLDLAAARPSGDPVRLQSVMTDLSHLKVISTVIDLCADISQTLSERHGLPPFSPTSLTSELLALSSDRWVDGSRFTSICKRFNMSQPLEAAVHFITGARNALREMPVQVFQSPEARQSLIDAAQNALDEAIDREEGLI